MRITEYPSVSSLTSDMVFVLDGTNGTKKISVSDLLFALTTLNQPAVTHRNTFRGKNLGTNVTSAQWTAIQDGTFADLWVGDYWVIGDVNWRIADINYWLRCGDTDFTQNHLAIVPDTVLYNAQMNTSNTTSGGYVNSAMRTTNLNTAKTTINNAFGSSHVLEHKLHLTNAVTNGYPSGGGWVNSTVDLMSESQVYGHPHFSPAVTCTGNNTVIPNLYTVDYLQFALFQLAPQYVRTRETYWLRDVVSSNCFSHYPDVSYVNYGLSAVSGGVRPCFAIG